MSKIMIMIRNNDDDDDNNNDDNDDDNDESILQTVLTCVENRDETGQKETVIVRSCRR